MCHNKTRNNVSQQEKEPCVTTRQGTLCQKKKIIMCHLCSLPWGFGGELETCVGLVGRFGRSVEFVQLGWLNQRSFRKSCFPVWENSFGLGVLVIACW